MKFVPRFLFKVSPLKKKMWVHLHGDAVSSTKRVCTRVLLQNAVRIAKSSSKMLLQNVRESKTEKCQKWFEAPHAISCCDPAWPAKQVIGFFLHDPKRPNMNHYKCRSDFSKLSSNSEKQLQKAARDRWLQHPKHEDFWSQFVFQTRDGTQIEIKYIYICIYIYIYKNKYTKKKKRILPQNWQNGSKWSTL
jgi:hypothetical protein